MINYFWSLRNKSEEGSLILPLSKFRVEVKHYSTSKQSNEVEALGGERRYILVLRLRMDDHCNLFNLL